MNAGCTMADMAEIDQVEDCWDGVTRVIGDDVVPVTYMNSTAALKAFGGRNGGAVCTSSNARAVLEWGFARKRRVLFFPDQHLGRNTGYRMGIPLEEMVVWDPNEDRGGLSDDEIRSSRILLWKGHCSVHNRFTPADGRRASRADPGRQGHRASRVPLRSRPEGRRHRLDRRASSRRSRKARRARKWAVGTELNMVMRMARELAPGKQVVALDDCFCLCGTMFRIDPPHLLWCLEALLEGRIVNRVSVPEDTARDARVALDRMLTIT